MGNVQQHIGKRVEIGRYQVETTKYLGEGGSSFIFLVKDVQRESAKPMVLKRLIAENDASYALIQNEIDMHQRFRHPQIVEYYASQVLKKNKSEREVYILMEYCTSGHLFENMTKMGTKRFSEKDLLRLFRSLCVPVSVLHHWDPPIAHRDLKLENFLLAQNGVYKLCDFGSCVDGPQSLKTKEDRARESEHVLKRTTAMYRSPELADVEGTAMFGSGELTEAVDIWAMGCVLYTMAFFKPPFPPEGLRTERYTVPKESPYSADVHQLIARMLLADVERRATIDHVIDCIDALLDDKPLPRNPGAAPASPAKKAAPPPAKKPVAAPAPASREGSFESPSSAAATSGKKTAEARKETVAKKPAGSDLLDMEFNPTISSPPHAAAAPAKADPFSGGGGGAGWTNAAAPTESFANFANFPTSPTGNGGAAVAPTQTFAPPPAPTFDAFGFPASPVKQPQGQGFTSGAMPTNTMGMPHHAAADVDPFAGLSGSGGAGGGQMGGGGYKQPQQQQQQYGMEQHHQQGFQQNAMMPPHQQMQQQQMWGQQQQQQQQQHHHQQQWGQPPHQQQQQQPRGGFPNGF